MNIGITCYPTHGGSGVLATELGKQLALRGHSISFISYSAPLRLVELPSGVTFHEVEMTPYPLLKQYPYTLALAAKMVEVATVKKIQILHVHYAIPFSPAAILARQMAPELNLKVVTTLHGTDTSLVGAAPYFHPVTRFSIEQSDAVTTVSKYLSKESIDTFNIKRKISVIPNFVDLEHYTSKRANLKKEKTVLHISNFRPVKRTLDVIKIFARIAAFVQARLVLVGDGPDLGRAMELARSSGINDRIELSGVVDNVAPYLQSADLLLLPSDSESFGLVALEAMASGVPVVASKVGGLPEVVPDKKAGFLIQAGNIEEMSLRSIQLLSDEQKHKKFSEEGIKASKKYDCDLIVPRFEDLYRDIIADDNKQVF